MRIGFDAKRVFHNFTGLGNYSRFIISAMLENYPQEEYFLFTPSTKSTPETELFIEKCRIVEPSNLSKKLGLKSAWRSIWLDKAAKKHQLDLYHGLSNEVPILKSGKFKKVITVHDLIAIRYPELYPAIDRKIYKYKFKQSFAHADHIVAISEQTKSDIIEFFGVDEDTITVIYQGVHDNFQRSFSISELQAIKTKYNLPDQFLLNVGTIEKRKNTKLILESLLESESGLPLVIVGKPTEYKDELDAFIKLNRLQSSVQFIHDIDFPDLPGIYQLCDIFIYPSIFEGFGIPILEAITCGKPVITSTGSCFAEAGGAAAKYVNPEDATSLAKTIDTILSSDEAYSQLTDAGKNHIKSFSKQKISSDLMELYGGILGY